MNAEIVDRLVQTFDDSNHVVNDTVFFFSGGDAVFASRSVLASQCQHLIPLLYNSEGQISCDRLHSIFIFCYIMCRCISSEGV